MSDEIFEINRFDRGDGHQIAFERITGRSPTVVFLGGFRSDMMGTKASFLADWCREHERSYLRFDYYGHGLSSGEFFDGTIGRWIDDAVNVIENTVDSKVVLVGSSMGGWIMLHVAMRLKDKVEAMIGVAAAPDFTRDLMQEQFDAAQSNALSETGRITLQTPYNPDGFELSQKFFDDGEQRLVLGDTIAVDVPVRLLHGLKDEEVPWQISLRLLDALKGEDVRVMLLKDADHRFSEPDQLQLIATALDDLLVGDAESG